MSMAKDRRFTIYALCDPRNEYQAPQFQLCGASGVRYVGQTFKSIEHRFRGHLLDDSNPYKKNWIRSLQRQGLEPSVVPLHADILTQEEADKLETELIAQAREQMGAKLLNLAAGGQGGYYTDEQMEESRTRNLSGPDGYERPGNTPYPTLRDQVCSSVRAQMMIPGNLDVQEIAYTAKRSTLRQLSTIQIGTKAYVDAYEVGLSGEPLPPGKLVDEAGYLHGRLVQAGYAQPLSEEPDED